MEKNEIFLRPYSGQQALIDLDQLRYGFLEIGVRIKNPDLHEYIPRSEIRACYLNLSKESEKLLQDVILYARADRCTADEGANIYQSLQLLLSAYKSSREALRLRISSGSHSLWLMMRKTEMKLHEFEYAIHLGDAIREAKLLSKEIVPRDFSRFMEDDRITIAKISAEHDPIYTAKNMPRYLITRQEALKEIAKIAFKTSEASKYIGRFGIIEEKDLIELAFFTASQKKTVISIHLHRFKIKEENILLAIGKKAAENNCTHTMAHLHCYRLQNIQNELEIFFEALRHSKVLIKKPFTLFFHSKFSDPSRTLLLQANIYMRLTYCQESGSMDTGELQTLEWEWTQFRKSLIQCAEKTGIDFTFILCEIDKKDPIKRADFALWLCQLFYSTSLLSKEKIHWLNESPSFLLSFYFLHPSSLRYRMSHAILHALNSEPTFCILFEELQHSSEKQRYSTFLHILLTLFSIKGSLPFENVLMISKRLHALKHYRNVLFFKPLITSLCLLYLTLEKEKIFQGDALLSFLNKILPQDKNDLNETRVNQKALISLIESDSTEDLASGKEIQKILEDKFYSLLPMMDHVQNFAVKYSSTIANFRSPNALMIYCLNMHDKFFVLKAISTYVSWVIHGKFHQKRYSKKNSPHLKKIFEGRKELRSKWIQGDEQTLNNILQKKTYHKDDLPDFRKLLIKKLWNSEDADSSHAIFPFLKQFLEPKHESFYQSDPATLGLNRPKGALDQEQLRQKLQEDKNNPVLLFQTHCIRLTKIKDYRQAISLLENIESILKNFGKHKKLQKSISKWLKRLKERKKEEKFFREWKVIDTGHPCDLLLSATEISEGTCLQIDKDPDFSQALTAYLIDGKIRMIAVKNEKGELAARRMLRMLWDRTNERPILVLEPIYPKDTDPLIAKAILEMAKKRAMYLGLDLVVSIKAQDKCPARFRAYVESLGSLAPCEYVDSIGKIGSLEDGIYTLTNLRLLYSPPSIKEISAKNSSTAELRGKTL